MYSQDRHVKVDANWVPGEAQRFIETVFNDTESVFAEHSFWPPHPDDGEPPNGEFFGPLYHGLAGVAWAQLELENLGYGQIRNDYVEACESSRKATVEGLAQFLSFNNRDDYLKGLLIAELGYLVTLCRLSPSNEYADAAIELIRGNLHNEVLELLWGSPGSMLYLAAMLESGRADSRYVSLLEDGLQFLKRSLTTSSSRQARLWQQNLYDEHVCLLGAGHGFAGNSLAILRAYDHLPDKDRHFWRDLIIDTTVRTADVSEGFANWQQSIDGYREGRSDWLVQFCHGAPGVICCLSELMGEDAGFDRLMIEAGELTWKAGPLKKGGGFCHGTAGNGWAFLKLFDSMGDELWLDRAKAFASSAIKQAEKRRAETGQWRYSLWTGDHGIALFADACLSHNLGIPTLERF